MGQSGGPSQLLSLRPETLRSQAQSRIYQNGCRLGLGSLQISVRLDLLPLGLRPPTLPNPCRSGQVEINERLY